MAVKKTHQATVKNVTKKTAIKKESIRSKSSSVKAPKVASKRSTKGSNKTAKTSTPSLIEVIIAAMADKKAQQITSMDLRAIESASTDYFVIAHAGNSTQVEAIAANVEDEVKKQLQEKALHTEGYQNAEWILLDYFNVVVHVFLEEKRNFYRLEQMWADADITNHNA
ncbi:MAG: ribosome silencing factor [Bacteroidia bacterium]|nr:ribosome silencing factor [Bacteroidia bacterium]HQU99643.1 ribosome silencing factor [Bacteroidia bacterium]